MIWLRNCCPTGKIPRMCCGILKERMQLELTSDNSSGYIRCNFLVHEHTSRSRYTEYSGLTGLRYYKSHPSCFLIILLAFFLTCNSLVLDGAHYIQHAGTVMRTWTAPTFACSFMGSLEAAMLSGWFGVPPRKWRRYIDDIFFLWNGTEKELSHFVKYLNRFHSFLKFKASYNFTTKSVNFLDMIILITDAGFIKTAQYTKPGKKCTFSLNPAIPPLPLTISPSFWGWDFWECVVIKAFLKSSSTHETLQSRGYHQKSIGPAFKPGSYVDRSWSFLEERKEYGQ